MLELVSHHAGSNAEHALRTPPQIRFELSHSQYNRTEFRNRKRAPGLLRAFRRCLTDMEPRRGCSDDPVGEVETPSALYLTL